MNKLQKIAFMFFAPLVLFSQNQTVGLFQYDSSSFEGYTLFSPNEYTYLIDNCGKLVHSWQSIYKPGNSVYLLEDGTLLRTCRIQNTTFSGGGSGGRVEKVDWNNNIVWSYNFSNFTYHQHHDIAPMPNGNILVLCWEYKSYADAIAAGRNPNALANNELWPTYILEAEPLGNNNINIVWEWHLWDHLVQDFDSSKANYGIVANHPELLNINCYLGNGTKDWLHANSIDYNALTDEIVISGHNLSEFFIIDHSTTIAQAATHSGGNASKGGDILYRWGNPMNYDRGSTNDKVLFSQHDVHWIKDSLPDGGKIMIFNNGAGRGFSSIDIINPSKDMNGNYYLNSNNRFSPDSAEWNYQDPTPSNFYASYISGAQRLEGGNTLICDGPHGTFFEIDDAKNKVWEYVNPVINTGPLSQGDTIPITQNGWANTTFRCTRYAPNYPAFQGINLVAGTEIELNPLPSNCEVNTSIAELNKNKTLLFIMDILGRKTLTKHNEILLYIFDDGTVEKRINIY